MRKSPSKCLVDFFSENFVSAILLHRRDRHLQCDQTNGAQFAKSHICIIAYLITTEMGSLNIVELNAQDVENVNGGDGKFHAWEFAFCNMIAGPVGGLWYVIGVAQNR